MDQPTAREKILGALRKKGVAPTPQRTILVAALAEMGKHPTAGMILKKVRECVPSISS